MEENTKKKPTEKIINHNLFFIHYFKVIYTVLFYSVQYNH